MATRTYLLNSCLQLFEYCSAFGHFARFSLFIYDVSAHCLPRDIKLFQENVFSKIKFRSLKERESLARKSRHGIKVGQWPKFDLRNSMKKSHVSPRRSSIFLPSSDSFSNFQLPIFYSFLPSHPVSRQCVVQQDERKNWPVKMIFQGHFSALTQAPRLLLQNLHFWANTLPP